jgi:hypothetical protein
MVVVGFLGAKTPVCNWLIGLVCIGVILAVLFVVEIALSAKKDAERLPLPFSYREDVFFGVRWRWRYDGHDIIGLHCLCLNCGLQIYFADASAYDVIPRVAARCDDCGRPSQTFDGNHEMLESHVIRLIHRNLGEGSVKAKAMQN